MLAPSVWNTGSNYGKCKMLSTTCTDDKQVSDYIGKQSNNHFISLVLPSCNQLPPVMMKNILQCEYYMIKELDFFQLFTPLFLQCFVNNGKFNAVSDTDSDSIPRATITPNGILKLTIHRQLYYKLGLEGKILNQSKSKNLDIFYVIEITMRCGELRLSNKFTKYQKAFERCGIKLNWVMAWQATDEKICPSSIAKYFSDRGYQVLKCRPRVIQYSTDGDIVCPVIKGSLDGVFIESLIEWLGALTIHSPIPFDECMETEIRNNFKVISISGLITTDTVLMLYKYIMEMLRAPSSSLPWVSIHVQGFDKIKDHYTVLSTGQRTNVILSPS